jgi:chemotaxis protein MotB
MDLTMVSLAQEHLNLQQKLADETVRSREIQQQNQKLVTDLRTQLSESGRLTHAMTVHEDKTKQLELLLGEKAEQNQKMSLTMAAFAQEHLNLQQKLADETVRSREIQQQNQKLATDLRTQLNESGRLTNTIAALEQEQGNLQLRLADQTARSQEVQQQNEKLEKELRNQTDKSGRLTNTIAGLLDENENFQQVLREKTGQNQKLDQLLVKARQNSQILSTELTRFQLDKEDWETNEKLFRTKVSQLEGQLVEFRELEKLKQKRVESLNQAQKNLDAGLKTHLKKNQLGIQRKQNSLILQLPDQILFDSGSADVKPGGQTVLRKVGQILKTDLGNMLIQIGGHTDNVPLSSTSGSLFPSNWELSAARAVNVVHFFETTLGIDPERMSAVGYAEHRPIASNTTLEGRARNRRIEIVVGQP